METVVKKEPLCQCRRCNSHGFNPWFGMTPWRREWQPTPVFLPWEFPVRGAWWATVHRVAKSQAWMKRLSTQAALSFKPSRGIQLHGPLPTPVTGGSRITEGQATLTLLVLARSCIQTTPFWSKPTSHWGRKSSVFTNHPLQNKLPRWSYYSFMYPQSVRNAWHTDALKCLD